MSLAGGGRTNDQPIENTTATNNTASQTITVAVGEKTRICHFDTSGASKVIIVANRALPDHIAHGDCPSILPKGTVGCTCAAPPEITSFGVSCGGGCTNAPSCTISWTSTGGTSAVLEFRRGGNLLDSVNVATNGSCNGATCFNTITICGDTFTLVVTGPGGNDSETIVNQ